jgi:hypothetical protein
LQKQNALLEKRVVQLENQLHQLTHQKSASSEQANLMSKNNK